MADQYAPPTGPPPPKVPSGWKAQYNEQYKEWFFVNLHTKRSQWEQPTSPARGASEEAYPSGPPPGYTGSDNPALSSNNTTLDAKQRPLTPRSNSPYGSAGTGAMPPHGDDAALAARLQAEEDARARGHSPRPPDMQQQNPGAANTDYYGQPMAPQQHQFQQGPNPQLGYPGGAPGQQYGGGGDFNDPHRGSRPGGGGGGGGGLLGKLAGKLSGKPGGSSGHGGYGGYPQYGYGGGGGGYPPHGGGYGGYPQHGYGGGMMGGGGHRPPPRKGGMGAGGAAALGVGGGLLGGAMLANAMDDDNDYQDGYQDGQQDDFGDGGGGDMGDMGGDMGGGE